ncbi:mitochondrial protein C2orf69 homolog isoform X2 [Hydra vulgaris]|uniref:Mitochondrial protein C2orf69 homolog isoform X2 n=1 Tax=Hydra vulgaris TaxID=6087 RepID=A0ABM4CTM8_HYDVU
MENNIYVQALPDVVRTHVPLAEENGNDVLYYHANEINQIVILFPGDVQDFRDKMQAHRDNYVWKDFSLENTAKIIYDHFELALVVVIRASRLHLNTFASYKNFVDGNLFGVPKYSNDYIKAISRLHFVLQALYKEVANGEHESLLNNLPITVLGFSKGCVVLNQMLCELPLLEKDQTLDVFFSKISAFHWLDSGNCGQSGAYIVNESCLSYAARMIPKIYVYSTPYQINDDSRPWISIEREKFIRLMKKNKAFLKEAVLFSDIPRSLEKHFLLLKEFSFTAL